MGLHISLKGCFTVTDYLIAFLMVLAASSLICILGNRLAPKTEDREPGKVQYACGEKPIKVSQRLQASLYRYLVYFLVIDSSLLIIAFSVFEVTIVNLLPLMMYLSIILVSVFLFLDGGKQ
ncbi:MAG: hypothetical protein ACFFEK_08510 [Candidatus Thorarchaeota archaeon]